MKRIAIAVVLSVGLCSWLVVAQDAGAPRDRGDRSAGRERRPSGGNVAEGWRPPPSPIIEALDANGDGTIEADEIAGAAAALKALDKDGNGRLTADEYRPRGPGGPPAGGPGGPPADGPGERGGRERGARSGPDRPAGDRAGGGQDLFDSTPLPRDDAEKKILAALDDLDRKERQGMMSVPRDDGRYLRLMTEAVGAKSVVELGTSHGYSAIWLCLALRTTGGKLTTFEIDAGRAALARKNFARAGVDSMVTLVEGDAHKEVTKLKDPIDVLFLDADKQGYVDYLEKLLPLVRPGGLIIAHNMDARQADPRYVKAITTNPKLETLFVHLRDSGIGVTLKKR